MPLTTSNLQITPLLDCTLSILPKLFLSHKKGSRCHNALRNPKKHNCSFFSHNFTLAHNILLASKVGLHTMHKRPKCINSPAAVGHSAFATVPTSLCIAYPPHKTCTLIGNPPLQESIIQYSNLEAATANVPRHPRPFSAHSQGSSHTITTQNMSIVQQTPGQNPKSHPFLTGCLLYCDTISFRAGAEHPAAHRRQPCTIAQCSSVIRKTLYRNTKSRTKSRHSMSCLLEVGESLNSHGCLLDGDGRVLGEQQPGIEQSIADD